MKTGRGNCTLLDARQSLTPEIYNARNPRRSGNRAFAQIAPPSISLLFFEPSTNLLSCLDLLLWLGWETTAGAALHTP